jgi:transferrin binding protein
MNTAMATALRATVLSIIASTLGACGGGSGGGSGSPTPIPPAPAPNQAPANQNQTPAPGQTTQGQNNPPGNTPRVDVPFTQFSMVLPNTNVLMPGTGRSVTGTHMSNGAVTSIDQVSIGSLNLALGFDGQRTLSTLTFNSPEIGNVVFDRAAGDTITCPGAGFCTASNHKNASAFVGDAFANGWNYQTFGAWATQTGPNTLVLSAMSAGNVTPGSAVPTTGLVTFGGFASGYFIDPAGTQFRTGANLFAQVDFQKRAIDFRTTGTEIAKLNTSSFTQLDTLNLSGTLSWTAGQNAFGGPVKSGGNPNLNGEANGFFYGPNAQEMGGTYTLQGGGVSRMVGGFGAKQR